jgi:hypothetical protein
MWINLPISFPGFDKQFKRLEALIMASQAQVLARLDEVFAKAAAEKVEVLAAIADLKAAIEAGQDNSAILAKVEELGAADEGICTPDEPPAPPVEPTPVVDDDLA